ncbi:hypothetical protein CL176_07470 [Suicoccus acidiformans]|uniref:LysM domain-containing protein n=1 Tax=Suicoccus acidiformans TaxID=2036206 RepID=A0A347WL92_9LACT|nr:LysM domain-containing protein [Suicoccus acidiformans]AXY25849.1 hypothetical protein CL176_07470 [Suicoccus acidiformans]
MPKDKENEFNDDRFEEQEDSFEVRDEQEVDPSLDEPGSRADEESRRPWNRRFGQDENPKNRQYSRSARNQPAKEATTLSRVLLAALILTVLLPFILWGVISAQRDNKEIAERTTEQVMISRNSEASSTSEESSSEESSSESSVSSSSRESESEDESSSMSRPESSITPPEPVYQDPAVAQEPVYEEPAPTAGTTHTVSAGESWYAIARMYGVDVYTLAAANGASIDTPIHPGAVIQIP